MALIAALIAPVSPVAAAMVSGIAVNGNVVTLSFDDAVRSAEAFVLNTPPRVAVDLGGIVPGTLTASGGSVVQTRMGSPRPGVGRVVLDLAGPSVVQSATLADDRRSMTLTLAEASPRQFATAVRAGRTTYGTQMALLDSSGAAAAATPVSMTAGTPRGGLTVPLDEPAPYRLPMPTIAGRADKPLVVIDAGHGGHDPGSLSLDGRYREKDAALAIAKALRNELLASGRVRVAMTRSDDSFVTLPERPEIARRLKADLFISVHCDSAPGSNASGATVYTLSEVSSDRVAARLAAKENRAGIINGVDLNAQSTEVGNILIDLTQRETMNTSARFAEVLQRELTGQGVDFKTTYHRFAGLAVLKAPDVPAVLLETGYISNPDDLQRLFSKNYQHKLAEGVTRAVEAHFARRLGRTDVASRE